MLEQIDRQVVRNVILWIANERLDITFPDDWDGEITLKEVIRHWLLEDVLHD